MFSLNGGRVILHMTSGGEAAKMSLSFLAFLFVLCPTDGFLLAEPTPASSQRNVTCADSGEINCETADVLFNVCSDIHHAKLSCKYYCKLCDLVDGNWTDWSAWSSCDVTCGTGNRTRTRTCTNPAPAHLGLDCPGTDSESTACSFDPCPVTGGWSAWGTWGMCSVSCDVGIQRRDRTCSNPHPQYFGDHCFGDSIDNRLCFPGHCEDGGWSAWTSWSSCSKSCGVGIMTRERSCNNPTPSLLGSSCTGPASQFDTCATPACTDLPNVSFFVTNPLPTLNDMRPIFASVIQNVGGYYNVSTGVFTGTVAGLYHFAFNFIGRSDNHTPFCRLYYNNKDLVYVEATGREVSGTMAVYLILSIGDTIDVRCFGWENIYQGPSMWFTGSFIRK